jgi:hypothetical protein
MPKKQKKRKRKEPEHLTYEIEVEDWEVEYHFGINKVNRNIISGDYWEHSGLILSGKILSPTLKNAVQTKIHIAEKPDLNDHWKVEAAEHPPLASGWMEILSPHIS